MAMAGLRLAGRMVLLISRVGLRVRDGFLRWRLGLGCRFLLLTHGSLHLLETHDLPSTGWLRSSLRLGRRSRLRRRLGGTNTPDATVDIEVGHRLGILVFFIPRAGGAIGLLYRLGRMVSSLGWCLALDVASIALALTLGGGRPGGRLLSVEAEMLLLNGTSYFGGLSKEVKVLSNLSTANCTAGAGAGSTYSSKGIIVEGIVGVVELVSETIVGVFELESVVYVCFPPRQPRKGIMSLGEARPCLVVTACVESEERHDG
jgi:hypothetical protein